MSLSIGRHRHGRRRTEFRKYGCAMPGSLLGTNVRRVEDPDLLTGRGTYVGNLSVERLAQVVFVRSPVAHARILSIDLAEAENAPGVVAVLTAADLGIEPFHGFILLNDACARPP